MREDGPRAGRGCARGSFYWIGRGDTLLGLARRFAVTPQELLAANPGLVPARVRVGQVVVIPSAAPREEGKTMEYRLKEGETLGDVLRRFEVGIRQLRQLNPGVDVLSLRGGMRIVLPAWPEDDAQNSYIVGRGEYLREVAARLGVEPIDLLRANPNLRPQEFCEGQRIRLPR